MNNSRWNKERLLEQLKFFGAKKQKFISCYAKKPRVLCKAQVTVPRLSAASAARKASLHGLAQQNALRGLHQDPLNGGMQNSCYGYNSLANANSLCRGVDPRAGLLGSIGGCL